MMLQGAEHKLACGCSVLYALNGTVCMSHDIRYCETHSGAELARLRARVKTMEEERNDLLRQRDERDDVVQVDMKTVQAECDALKAENRAILRLVDESHDLFRTACNVARDGIARGVSVDDAAKIMRDAVETRIGAINVAFRNFDAAREVERVKKLEAVAVAAREMRTCLVVSGDDRVARVHETGCCGLVGAALAALDAVEARK